MRQEGGGGVIRAARSAKVAYYCTESNKTERMSGFVRFQPRCTKHLRQRVAESFDFLVHCGQQSLSTCLSGVCLHVVASPKSDFFGLGLSPIFHFAAQTRRNVLGPVRFVLKPILWSSCRVATHRQNRTKRNDL